MKEYQNSDLTKRFELKIVEEPIENKDSKDDSIISSQSNNYRPPSDYLKSLSNNSMSRKFNIRRKNDKRRKTYSKDSSENKEYLDILRRRSFHGMNNIQGKKFVNYKAIYKDSFTYSDSEENTKVKNYEYPTNIFNQIFFAWTIKLFRLAQKNGQLRLLNLGKFSITLEFSFSFSWASLLNNK